MDNSTNKKLLDLIFPRRCLGCQKINQILCERCLQSIPVFSSSPRHLVSNKNKCLDKLIVASDWANPLLKNLIYDFKYNFVSEIGQILGGLLVRSLEPLTVCLKIKKPLLIPIPLHPLRLHWRGFNQAEILANIVGKKFDWPVINNLIIRKKHTRPQMTIDNISNRYDNVSGIFSLKSSSGYKFSDLSKRTIFLVDDVCTTGATMEEAMTCVKKRALGCYIYGLVLARA